MSHLLLTIISIICHIDHSRTIDGPKCGKEKCAGYSTSNYSCSVCGRENLESGEDKCFYPFEYRFAVVNNECKHHYKSCQEEGVTVCERRGRRCYSGFVERVCLCKFYYYGDRCVLYREQPNFIQGLFPQMIQVFIQHRIQPLEKLVLYVVCSISLCEPTDYTEVISTEGDVRYRRSNYTTKDCSATCLFYTKLDRQWCLFLDYFVDPKKFRNMCCYMLFFIYRVKWDNVLYVEDRIAGYYVNHSINMYINKHIEQDKIDIYNQVIFNHTYPQFVQYPEDLSCYPVINFQSSDCGPRRDKATSYLPSQEINIRVVIKPPEYFRNCESTEFKEFKVWHQELNATEEPEGLTLDNIGHRELYAATDFLFPPYTLGKGVWKVQFKTKYITRKTGEDRTNINNCFFRIEHIPIVAIIDGGTERYVNKERGVRLQASSSYDPNVVGGAKDKLKFWWECIAITATEPCIIETNYKDSLTLSKSNINVGTYNVTLEVKSGESPVLISTTHQTLIVGEEDQEIELTCITCEMGSIANPREYINLKVKYSNKVNISDLIWSYAEGDGGEYKSADHLRASNTDEDIFALNPFNLADGIIYLFKVSVPNKDVKSVVKIFTPYVTDINCGPEPNEITQGRTVVTVKCTFPSAGESFIYEIFDNTKKDSDLYSGRMLMTSSFPVFDGLRLAYGATITVNKYSKVTKTVQKTITEVESQIFNGTTDNIEDWIVIMKENVLKHHYERAMQYASLVAILWPTNSTADGLSQTVIKILISAMEKIPLTTTSYLKMYLSTTKSIVDNLIRIPKAFHIDVEMASRLSQIITRITRALVKRIINIRYEITITNSIKERMTSALFDIAEGLMEYRNKECLEKPRYFVNPKVMELVQETSRNTIKNLDIINYVLLREQVPGDKYTEVPSESGNIYAWVKVSSPEALHNLTHTKSTIIPLLFSSKLAKSVEKLTRVIGIEFTRVKLNPFYWAGGDISTDLYSLIFCLRSRSMTCRYETSFHFPMKMYHDISTKTASIEPIHGRTRSVNTSEDELGRDLDVTIYRFDPPIRAKMFVQFLFPSGASSAGFKVHFETRRPTLEGMKQLGQNISPQSPIYNLPYDPTDADKFYYMGIVPDNEISGYVNFSLKIYFVRCITWNRWQWSKRGCQVGKLTSTQKLECECTHLSFFAGSIAVPIYHYDPPQLFPLFLTIRENLLPLLVMLIILLLYILMMAYSSFRDRKDIPQRNVIILEDNYPGDRIAYVLGVRTGSRCNSSTTANVGFKLYGALLDSRAHVFKSSTRKVLKSNTDDWFLMYCPKHLGRLRTMQLWHDNSGKSPDWFVETIEVYDLSQRMEYIFEINEWLALAENEYPDALILPCDLNELFGARHLLVKYLLTGLRDTHLWTSILWKHPRNPVSRVVRVCVLLSFLMTAMASSLLLSLIFYKMGTFEDEPQYEITNGDVVIFAASFLLCASVTTFIIAMFRKTYVSRFSETPRGTIIFRDFKESVVPGALSGYSLYSIGSQANIASQIRTRYRYGYTSRQEKSLLETYANKIRKLFVGSTLLPVKLPRYRSDVIVHKKFCILSWGLAILLTIISCAIVLKFGWRLLVPVRGEKWVTIFISIILVHIFITGPLKIIIFSSILSLTYQNVVQPTSYNIKPKDGTQMNLYGNMDHLFNIKRMRSQHMYRPLKTDEKEIYRRKKIRQMYCGKVIDFVIVLSLLLVLSKVSKDFMVNKYQSNNQAGYVLAYGNTQRAPNYMDVFNKTNFENYLTVTYISQLYRFLWYNLVPFISIDEKLISRIDWTNNCVMKLMGNVRMRQLRVRMGSCRKNSVLIENFTDSCSPHWNQAYEDKDVYNVRWKVGGYKDFGRKSTAWRYTPPKSSNSSFYYGKSSALYHAGGYIADLGYEKKETQIVVADLMRDQWLDHYTRAVIVETTLFNVNTRSFSQVILIIEVMPTGQYIPFMQVESVSRDFTVNVWNLTFLIFTTFMFFRACYVLNRTGLFVFYSYWKNIFETVLVVLGYCTALLYLIHIKRSFEYIIQFQRGGLDQFFSFLQIIRFYKFSKVMLCILIGCAVIRLFMAWRFGRRFVMYWFTFYLSLPWIVTMTLYVIILFPVIWRYIGYTINVFVFHYYRHLVLHHFDYTLLRDESAQENKYRFIPYLMCIMWVVVNLLFITSFTYYYKISQGYRIIDVDTRNLIEIVKAEVKQRLQTVCKKRKSPQKNVKEKEKGTIK